MFLESPIWNKIHRCIYLTNLNEIFVFSNFTFSSVLLSVYNVFHVVTQSAQKFYMFFLPLRVTF